MAVYGVGDHGGGPTRRYITRAIDMDTWPIWPRVQFSTSRRFFATLEKLNLPTWDKELNAEYSGCLISQSAIKRANRQAENALAEADAISALAHSACGVKIQSERLTLAWREALLTHFHDILPGSGVAATRNYTLGMTQRILADTSSIQSKALATLAAAIDTSTVGAPNLNVTVPTQMPVNLGAGSGFTVGGASGAQPVDGWPVAAILTNPTTWSRSEIATLRVWEGNIPWGSQPSTTNFALRNSSGETVSAQFLRTGRYWGHTYIDVAAPVAVAANGWTTYAVLADAPAQAGSQKVEIVQDLEGSRNHPPVVPLPSGRLGFDNEVLSVRFDRVRGGIKSLIHRPSGKEFVPVGACLGLPVIAVERPYPMSSWIINDHKSSFSPTCESLEVTAEGPFLATIVAKFHHADSRITLTWTLGAGENHLRLNVEVRWLEHGSQEKGTPRLSLSLPLNIVSPVATAEIPFGTIERHEKPGRTMPCVRYFAVNGSCSSVTIANDGLSNYALEADGATIHLLRSSYSPDPLPEISDHTWNLTLAPSPEGFSAAKAHQQAVNLNHPLRWTITDGHPGRLPATSSDILTCTPKAAITQVKPAEDGKGIILRIQELAGLDGKFQIDLDPAVWGTISAATPVDLLERPCSEGPVLHQSQSITASLTAHGILSIRVCCSPR
jgi:alpha-mannosidase